ncbi:MAG TPA: hypothetical protein VF174_08155 [Micromonosporaceae bacterium]
MQHPHPQPGPAHPDTDPPNAPPPERCGCTVPLVWDATHGVWRHLDDFTACDPSRPRPTPRIAWPDQIPRSALADVLAYLKAQTVTHTRD